MKSLFVAAGLFGAVGLLTAAPASAQGRWKSPALRPSCATSPERPDKRPRTSRRRRGARTRTSRRRRDARTENIATAPGRAVPEHRDGAGTRVPRTSPRRRDARSRTSSRRRNARWTTSARRSDLLPIRSNSRTLALSRHCRHSKCQLCRSVSGTRSSAPLWSIRRRGGRETVPYLAGTVRAVVVFGQQLQLGDVRFPAPARAFADRHVWLSSGHRRQQDLVDLDVFAAACGAR